MKALKSRKIFSFIYPYFLYHLLILWNWLMWVIIPTEVSLIATIFAFIIIEVLLMRSQRNEGKINRSKIFTSIFFLTLPLIFVVILMYFPPFMWLKWAIAFFYVNHAVFLDYELGGMLLLTFFSFLVGFFPYLVFKRFRILMSLYIPWLIFISPIVLKYAAGGTFSDNIDKYNFIERIVDPVRKERGSIIAPPAPRGLFIENDKAFTVYESTIIPSFAEERLFIYRMDTEQLSSIKLPGMGVRRLYSKENDPYIYILLWKMNPGIYRIDKKRLNREGLECLVSLESSYLVSKELAKLYQVGNLHVSKDGESIYLISDSYPAVGKYFLRSKLVNIIDLYKSGFCPSGSILGFMPSVDYDERYMYLSLTNCYCGVVKIDLKMFDVVGCYEIQDPRRGFYGVTFYKDGKVIAFPVVKNLKTVFLNAENMSVLRECESPPFHYIRDIIELDSDNLLCLGFFGDLAIFNISSCKYKVIISNLGFAMGLFKHNSYIYFNTALYGILRIKINQLLKIASEI